MRIVADPWIESLEARQLQALERISLNITNSNHKNKIESAVFDHFINNEFHISY